MSKIICDVCGTSYPDTATQCPICGCVRPGDAQSVSGSTGESGAAGSTYNYVKGGRFSKANVRKRNKANAVVSVNMVSDLPAEDEPDGKKSNKGLVVVAVVLLLAIVAVVIYIALRFFMPDVVTGKPDDSTGSTGDSQSAVQTTDATVPCEGITLDVKSITLDKEGAARMLYATVEPAGTTDQVVFTSDNTDVATVSADGKVTAVAPGQTTVTATCGQFSAQCEVACTFEPATEETTEETTEATTEDTTAANDEFKLNRMDITFNYKGESWVIYSGSVGLTAINWSSDNEAVATIENGKVVAAGSGMTTVYGEYDGQKASCIIRCNFSDAAESTGVSGSGGVSEDGGGVSEDGGSSGAGTAGGYKLYNPYGNAEDVSIKAGESFTLQFVDASGNYVSGVTWASANDGCCTVSDGTITGVASGMTTVSATYNGQSYSCTVRVG